MNYIINSLYKHNSHQHLTVTTSSPLQYVHFVMPSTGECSCPIQTKHLFFISNMSIDNPILVAVEKDCVQVMQIDMYIYDKKIVIPYVAKCDCKM